MTRSFLACLAGALACCATLPAHAVGRRIDVRIVDRTTGETLTPILHDGQWWVAGRPGARYRVAIVNRDGQRTLNVVSIDGVNAISGDTAAWDQTGYVLDASDRYDVDGWRKNLNEVAAFEFAALPDSYAARTGRPGNVGVIGVAMFHERRVVVPVAKVASDGVPTRRSALPAAEPPAATSDAAPPPLPAQALSRSEVSKAAPTEVAAPRDRLGTAHGAVEQSAIAYVPFVRARTTPDEIVTIHYDRLENLIAMGIVPRSAPPIAADPFPGSSRFVPDPPPR